MNKEDLTIGILIPVYNVADYVEECIESILTQIDTRASILIMNDASTDNSAAIIKRFENYPQVQIFDAPYNRGLSDTRNALFDMGQTEYIWFIDSDDVMYEGAYKAVMSQIEKLNSDVLCADYVSLRGKKEVNKKGFIGTSNKNYINKSNSFLDNIIENNSNHVWNKVFRRQIIQDIRFKEGLNFEDILYMTDISLKSFQYSYLKQPVIKYREREGSILKNIDKKYVDDYLYAFTYRVENYQRDGEKDGYHYLLYKVYKRYIGLLNKIAKNHQEDLLKDTYAQYNKYFSELYLVANKELRIHQRITLNIKRSKLDKILKGM
ncbi:glycosyltransferase family 2 protein [Psychrobacter immobilis]|uniref:glycosyltransferase family 2 protein n=1 Tax=Psychrobacter immobilis TaxID=498 RepID=UPI00191AD9FF|nr:glycosyltransferase [Psychrobacter immobilis]